MDLFSNSSECIVLIKNGWKACMHVFWGLGMSSDSTTIYRLSCMHANSPESIGTIIVFFSFVKFSLLCLYFVIKKRKKRLILLLQIELSSFFVPMNAPKVNNFTPLLYCRLQYCVVTMYTLFWCFYLPDLSNSISWLNQNSWLKIIALSMTKQIPRIIHNMNLLFTFFPFSYI